MKHLYIFENNYYAKIISVQLLDTLIKSKCVCSALKEMQLPLF